MFLTIVGLITGRLLETVLFAVSFLPLRSSCGGYHAKTHLKCFITLAIVYVLFLILLALVTSPILALATIAMTMFALPILFFMSPVEHENNPLEKEDRKKLTLKSQYISLAISVLIIFLVLILKNTKIAFSLSYGMVTVACSMLNVKTINKIRQLTHKG